jgi:hypothetical protein
MAPIGIIVKARDIPNKLLLNKAKGLSFHTVSKPEGGRSGPLCKLLQLKEDKCSGGVA